MQLLSVLCTVYLMPEHQAMPCVGIEPATSLTAQSLERLSH